MIHPNRTPFHHVESKELLGYILKDVSGWQAQTIFGYTIARTMTKKDAQQVLQNEGLSILKGVWHYFDGDDQQWHPCILKETDVHRVTVIRTNAMGYQVPEEYKLYTIKDPTENKLVKA